MKMSGRVFVLRRIATSYMAARKAEPKMDPPVAHLETLLTTLSAGLHIANLVQVLAFVHRRVNTQSKRNVIRS